jgi:hypothetical protein
LDLGSFRFRNMPAEQAVKSTHDELVNIYA